MDPKSITNLDWNNIGVLINLLWILLISIVVFGGSFLTAHIFLHSLVSTGATDRRHKGLRLLLYSISGAAFAAAALVATQTLSQLGAILHFYARFWI